MFRSPSPLESNVLFALLLTAAAGLSTGVGSAIGLLSRGYQPRLLNLALSFSAGVMLFVSLVEIFPKARLAMVSVLGAQLGYGAALVAFFGGLGVIAALDWLLPNHPLLLPEPAGGDAVRLAGGKRQTDADLLRTGLFTALAIAIHNFPEGLATFVGAIANPRLGISIALAIAIHNIPEGLAISAPVYYATGNRRLAFLLSFASGLAEPLGAVVGYLLLRHLFGPLVFGMIFASVSGIMVYVCLDELLPAAHRHGAPAMTMAGLLMGMAVMGLSLVLLA
ncbi:MAG: zinc transporter ZupT [Synechococcaceae cyanobacterium]|nr:zinc transporter ZupT [Synechococcaceae cyanobacterium]